MQNRDRRPVSFDLSVGLLERLDAYIRKQKYPPPKRTVIETALGRFFDQEDAVEKKRGAK